MTDRATELANLHADPAILVLLNVWDVASARAVAAVPGTRAIATASAAVAAAHGYDDGEQIPLDLMLASTARIVEAVGLPVTADLEAGYGDAGETVRRAVGVGVVGANIEDELLPVPDAVRRFETALSAARAEGVDLVLNARTDAYLLGHPEPLTESLTRGRAYLDAGATCFFVPGCVDEADIRRLVDELGAVSLLGVPGCPTPQRLEQLRVTRVSYGPFAQEAVMAQLEAMARVAAVRQDPLSRVDVSDSLLR